MVYNKWTNLKEFGPNQKMQRTIPIKLRKYNHLPCEYCENMLSCKKRKGIDIKENYCHWGENRFESILPR